MDDLRHPFGSKSRGKLSPRSYPIQFERKWNTNFLSAGKDSIFEDGNEQSERAEIFPRGKAIAIFFFFTDMLNVLIDIYVR